MPSGRAASPQTLIHMTVDGESDKQKAANLLVEMATTNATLRDHLIQLGAKTAVGDRIRTDNAKIFRDDINADVTVPRSLRIVTKETPLVSPASKRRIRAAASVLRLLAVVLPNGTRMADAKRADIEDAISTFEPQANDMLRKAAYYKAVRAKLPDGKKVVEVFDEAELTALYRAATAEAVPHKDAA